MKISQTNFLNFRELNVLFVATTPSTPCKLNPIIKLILKFDLLMKWYPFVPHFTQPYSVDDSELNLNSSMYTDMDPFFSNTSWRVIASIICRTPGWVFTTLLRSPHFLYLSFRLAFIILFIVFSLTSIRFLVLLINLHLKSLAVKCIPIKLLVSSFRTVMLSSSSFCLLPRYLLLSCFMSFILFLNSFNNLQTYSELTSNSFHILK